jgi:hypothetical protein
LEGPDNTPVLFNPLTYAEAITKGDYYLDSSYSSVQWSYDQEQPGRYRSNITEPDDYQPNARPNYNLASAITRGLVAEGGFALICLLLATLKWRQTRRDMLRDAET